MFKSIITEKLPKYIKADATGKSAIVTSIVEVSGMHRKAVIRALNRERKRSNWQPPPRLGRPKKFTAETDTALAWVWEQYDYPSAERLHGEVHEAIRIFARDSMWQYSEEATQLLWDMSLISMKRRTTAFARKRGLIRGASTTKPGALLKSVPVFFGS